MSTYKVIQDIEAEDKFLGPLTLKQFIFASIAVVCVYLSFLTLTKGVWVVSLILLPFIIVTGFLAFPWGREQPTEIWLAAKIRFFFKPRRRIWDQGGQSDLVTITAPKKVEGPRIDDLSQTEVKSRLQALGNMLDSRGWAVKNVNVNLFAQPSLAGDDSDRLIAPSALPKEVPAFEVGAADDILDPKNNPVAAHLDQMINASTAAHRQETVDHMKQLSANPAAGAPAPDFWFMNQPAQSQMPASNLTGFGTAPAGALPTNNTPVTAEELAVLKKVKAERAHASDAYGNTKVLRPGNKKTTTSKVPTTPALHTGYAAPDPAILGLASNDDLNVATIARQAKREQDKQSGTDEVVVRLR